MNTQYFINVETSEELTALYRKLAMKYHPDLGGDTATMQEINNQYAAKAARMGADQKRAYRDERNAEGHSTMVDDIDLDAVEIMLRDAIIAALNMKGIIVEICGLWAWCSGETMTNKDALKAAGYKWAPKKQMWYYAAVPSMGRGKWNMDEIRASYGSKRVVYAKMQLSASND